MLPVLSLFPGIGLLDSAFEEQGFTVVRGPDLLWSDDLSHRLRNEMNEHERAGCTSLSPTRGAILSGSVQAFSLPR